MKIQLPYFDKKQYPDCPLTVPDDILNEKHAWRNHGQTLSGLNERGGLSPCEAVAIAEKRRWHKMPINEAINTLKELVANHHESL